MLRYTFLRYREHPGVFGVFFQELMNANVYSVVDMVIKRYHQTFILLIVCPQKSPSVIMRHRMSSRKVLVLLHGFTRRTNSCVREIVVK